MTQTEPVCNTCDTQHGQRGPHILLSWVTPSGLCPGPSQKTPHSTEFAASYIFSSAYNQWCTVAVFSIASFFLDSDKLKEKTHLASAEQGRGKNRRVQGSLGLRLRWTSRLDTIRKRWGQGPMGNSQKDRTRYYKNVGGTTVPLRKSPQRAVKRKNSGMESTSIYTFKIKTFKKRNIEIKSIILKSKIATSISIKWNTGDKEVFYFHLTLSNFFKRLCKVNFALLNDSYILPDISEEKMRTWRTSLRKPGKEEGTEGREPVKEVSKVFTLILHTS